MQLTSTHKKLLIGLGAGLGLLVVLLAIGGFWINNEIKKPFAHKATEKIITIPPKSSTSAILAKLQQEGVINNATAVSWWLRTLGRGKVLKTGDYQFDSPISPLQVIDKLVRADVATRKITIPEGYNQWEIAEKLAAPLPGMKEPAPASKEELLPLFKNTRLIADLDPKATDLEGYLFPDTYEYTTSTTRAQIVEAMVKRFRKIYTPELMSQAQAMGMNTRQIITMASLIEKEAKVDKDRELISQVYHKRLKMGMNLACDPTVIYGAILAGKYKWNGKIYQSDLDRLSPYNTYKLPGLPPGPIASPGKRAIEAALNPAKTEYLYFVVDGVKRDGSHVFSTSGADHERAVGAYRQMERDQQAQPQATTENK
ncbi:MAG TPA: endolytic transglycosylase MltG [Blastocatellia bacterium]|nr:endolytic transglycosylase MltG [Blastocatellia bacterium]